MAGRTSSSGSSRHARHNVDSIGQFVIDQEIGKGSFAQVYSGRHKVSFESAHLHRMPSRSSNPG